MAGIDKNSSLEDKIIALNVMVLADKVDKTDAANFSWAKTLNKPEDMEQYFEKYLYTPESTSNPTQTPDREVKEDKPKKKRKKKYEKKPPTPEEHKAIITYKKLTRVTKYILFREEVLLDYNHTCFCCDKKFPTRSEYYEDNKETYPLFVRCRFPIVKYIETRRVFDVKQLIGDKKIFDHQNYTALCSECAPLPFSRKKDDTINEW